MRQVKYIKTLTNGLKKIFSIMKTIQITLQEIWQATRPVIEKNKKKYTRKSKHKNYEQV